MQNKLLLIIVNKFKRCYGLEVGIWFVLSRPEFQMFSIQGALIIMENIGCIITKQMKRKS